jgi:hypothetical protein
VRYVSFWSLIYESSSHIIILILPLSSLNSHPCSSICIQLHLSPASDFYPLRFIYFRHLYPSSLFFNNVPYLSFLIFHRSSVFLIFELLSIIAYSLFLNTQFWHLILNPCMLYPHHLFLNCQSWTDIPHVLSIIIHLSPLIYYSSTLIPQSSFRVLHKSLLSVIPQSYRSSIISSLVLYTATVIQYFDLIYPTLNPQPSSNIFLSHR